MFILFIVHKVAFNLVPCIFSRIHFEFIEQKYDSIALHYTVDACTAERYVFYDDDFRYNVNRENTQFPEVDVFASLADSLQGVFDAAHPVSPVTLPPHEVARQLLVIGSGVSEEEGDGESWRGSGRYRFGEVTHSRTIRYDFSEMSYEDMFRARNLLSNMDYGDYVLGLSDDDVNYLLPGKGRFTEVFWKGNSSMTFLYGNVTMSDMKTLVLDVVSEGLLRDRGVDGRFVVLRCNDWRFGMGYVQLSEALRGDERGVCRISLAQVVGEGEEMRLGRTRSYRFGPGLKGVKFGFYALPQWLLMEALRRSGR